MFEAPSGSVGKCTYTSYTCEAPGLRLGSDEEVEGETFLYNHSCLYVR